MIGLNRARAVGANETVEIGQNQSIAVAARQSIAVGESQSIAVGDSQSVKIGSEQSVSVGKTATEKVALAKMVSVGGAYQIAVVGAMNTTVMGLSAEEVGLLKKIVSGLRIELSCGESKLVLDRSGKVTIEGTDIRFVSKGPVSVTAETKVTVEAEETLSKATGKAELTGGSVQIRGKPIDLN